MKYSCAVITEGAANCAEADKPEKKTAPSADEWLREAKADPKAAECGKYTDPCQAVERLGISGRSAAVF